MVGLIEKLTFANLQVYSVSLESLEGSLKIIYIFFYKKSPVKLVSNFAGALVTQAETILGPIKKCLKFIGSFRKKNTFLYF